jgi:hypothetical protein
LKNKAANRHQQRQKWDSQMHARKQMSSEGLLDKEGKRKFHLKRSRLQCAGRRCSPVSCRVTSVLHGFTTCACR